MVDPLLALIQADGDSANVRRGNVMARQRMIVLYDRSAAFNALVAGTSNKTEVLLGYGTLHGDMAAAFAPIGDLYKTQLRSVATELGVPRADPRQAAVGRPVARPDRRGRAWPHLRCPGPHPVRARRPALDRRPMRACRPRPLAGRVGRAACRSDGVQAPDAARRQGVLAHARDRPPVPATASGLAPRLSGAASRPGLRLSQIHARRALHACSRRQPSGIT